MPMRLTRECNMRHTSSSNTRPRSQTRVNVDAAATVARCTSFFCCLCITADAIVIIATSIVSGHTRHICRECPVRLGLEMKDLKVPPHTSDSGVSRLTGFPLSLHLIHLISFNVLRTRCSPSVSHPLFPASTHRTFNH